MGNADREREYDVLVIGAGLSGCFIARSLSRFDLRIGVIEKSSYVAGGQTKANGGIVHGGHDPEPGTLKARLNVEGAGQFPALCAELGVKFMQTGIYVVAFDGEEEKTLERLLERGLKNGVRGLSIHDRRAVRENEPNVSEAAVAALSIPSGGIVDVVRLAIALADHAAINGTRFFFRTEVTGLVREGKKIVGVETDRGRFYCRYLVNCAGVHADRIMNMAGYEGFSILPRKGEYYILDKSLGSIVRRPCFPIPSPHGKGILIFPTVDGNAVIGGDSVPVTDREDTSTTADGFAAVQRGVKRIVPRVIDGDMIIAAFSGIRATGSTGDFFIGEAGGTQRLLNVAGIASPGLSAAPAVASLALSLLGNMGLPLRRDSGKSPAYRLPALFKDADDAERNEMLARNPLHGRVVCRCEGVTEGDIVEAVRAPVPATTLDAIKFRTRAGAGRCQGAFDVTRIVKILSREGGLSPLELEKSESGSRILVRYTRPWGGGVMIGRAYDVVVIGAGPAGIAAAIGAKAGGAGSVLLLDRDDRVGGILPQCVHAGFGLKVFGEELTGPEYAERYAERLAEQDVDILLDASAVGVDANKRVALSSPGTGVRSVEARAVVLAMGCRERTRGNVRIPGFRPSGIMTAGTAQRLINREGMMIGERIVVVGSGDIGLIMARRCTLEGARVEAVIEKFPYPSGLNRNVVQCLRDFDIPLRLGHRITFIDGTRRVAGVRFAPNGASHERIGEKERYVKCDTVLLSVGLIPEIELVRDAGIPVDPCSGGPVVDQLMHTEIDGFFAAGNLVQVYDLVDWVSMDGERAGRAAALYAAGKLGARRSGARIKRGEGIKCAVPQVLRSYEGGEPGGARLYLRVESVLKNPVFRFTVSGRVVGEVRRPYAVPSEIADFDASGLIGKIAGDCEMTVDVRERARRGGPPGRLRSSGPLDAFGGPEAVSGAAAAVGAAETTIPVTCILCPDSCLVRVFGDGGAARAEGARCAKGAEYAIKEVTDPRRTFTSSVKIVDGAAPVCPVRTTKPIRKGDWKEARRLVGAITAGAPVRCGQTLVRDFLERGIDLIATMSVGAAEKNINLVRGGMHEGGNLQY